ncbi:hypothetical protein MRB53_041904 [Persea americana]|nr:hypothetical protein MRB53_041904 [Persea americana]
MYRGRYMADLGPDMLAKVIRNTELFNREMMSQVGLFRKRFPDIKVHHFDTIPTFNTVLDSPTAHGAPDSYCTIAAFGNGNDNDLLVTTLCDRDVLNPNPPSYAEESNISRSLQTLQALPNRIAELAQSPRRCHLPYLPVKVFFIIGHVVDMHGDRTRKSIRLEGRFVSAQIHSVHSVKASQFSKRRHIIGKSSASLHPLLFLVQEM